MQIQGYLGSSYFLFDELGEVGSLQPILRTPLRTAIHQVPGVGISRHIRHIVVALVQKLPCEDGQTAFLHLQGHKALLFVVYLVVEFIIGHSVDYF